MLLLCLQVFGQLMLLCCVISPLILPQLVFLQTALEEPPCLEEHWFLHLFHLVLYQCQCIHSQVDLWMNEFVRPSEIIDLLKSKSHKLLTLV